MTDFFLKSEKVEIIKEREAVEPGDGRWPDSMFEPQIDELDLCQWFLGIDGLKGKLYFALACMCNDVEELQALRYAADPHVRYLNGEIEDRNITELHMNQVYIKNLEERNTRLKYGFV